MPRPVRYHATRRARVVAVALSAAALIALPSAAWADSEGETTQGYVLVQQALGYLAHEGTAGVEMAMDKVKDALATTDQKGVDVALVQEAKGALDQGDVAAAQAELQSSITVAVKGLAPAVGVDTGTTVVPSDLPGRGALSGLDKTFLAISILLVLVGAAIAARFRPADSVRVLRARLAGPAPVHSNQN